MGDHVSKMDILRYIAFVHGHGNCDRRVERHLMTCEKCYERLGVAVRRVALFGVEVNRVAEDIQGVHGLRSDARPTEFNIAASLLFAGKPRTSRPRPSNRSSAPYAAGVSIASAGAIGLVPLASASPPVPQKVEQPAHIIYCDPCIDSE